MDSRLCRSDRCELFCETNQVSETKKYPKFVAAIRNRVFSGTRLRIAATVGRKVVSVYVLKLVNIVEEMHQDGGHVDFGRIGKQDDASLVGWAKEHKG